VGRKWLVEQDIASSLQYRRDGKLTLRQWLASLRGIEELGYFARDDLRPFLALARPASVAVRARWRALLSRFRPKQAVETHRPEAASEHLVASTPAQEERQR
jgi:D-aspartate ligase